MGEKHNGSRALLEWCKDRRVSKSKFYNLAAQDRKDAATARESGKPPPEKRRVPRTHRVGKKVIISDEADQEWLAASEAEAEEAEATIAATAAPDSTSPT